MDIMMNGWRQYGCNDEWTTEFTHRFSWSVKIKLIHEVLFVWMCIGSFINWESPLEDVSENNFNPSIVSVSLDHQEEDLELKSPVTKDKDGLSLFMSFKIFSKLHINESNSSVLWLGERYNRYNHFFVIVTHF